MNSRYIAYAKANNLTPDAVLARDRVAYPAGCMAGFIVWTLKMWREFAPNHNHTHTKAEHDAFDAWLSSRF